jgi:hypothetical protein
MKAKVYGIERSGNNWLQWMLAANYRVKIMGTNYGWTHGPYSTDRELDGCLNFVISKHPLEWLPSIHRFHKTHHKMSIGEFIRERDVIERWNNLYAGHVGNAEKFGVTFLRYDDLLRDPERILNIAVDHRIPRKTQPFRSAENDKMTTRMNLSGKPFNKRQYLEKKYMDHYTPEVLAEAMRRFDWGVAEKLGYGREP